VWLLVLIDEGSGFAVCRILRGGELALSALGLRWGLALRPAVEAILRRACGPEVECDLQGWAIRFGVRTCKWRLESLRDPSFRSG
jgi:hypothetical protein